MNRVLVTGLALGKETGACDVCNWDFEWLIRYPSVLLWADTILVSGAIWDTISKGEWPHKYAGLARCLQLIFDIARTAGIIEVFDPGQIISPGVRDDIFEQVARDRLVLPTVFPDHSTLGDDQNVPGQVLIDGYEYCRPRVWSIYAGLALARALDGHCLFDDSAFNYCRYKFGLSGLPAAAEPGSIESFHRVFQAYLPNDSILPDYALASGELCAGCAKEQRCRDTYLSQVEGKLKELLAWRDYDEIAQMKAVLGKVVRRRKKAGGIVDPAEIIHDLRGEETKLRRRVRSVFPRVRRWANITTVVSIPLALAGVATSSPVLTLSAAGAAGASQVVKELVELLSSRYSWIGFVSKETELHTET